MSYLIFIGIKMAQRDYFLIGHPKQRIFGRKPPTLKQLLQNVVFENKENKKSIRESVKLVTENAMDLWNRCGIKTIRFDHCVEKLEKEYLEWQHINENRRYETNTQEQLRESFKAKLDVVFDVSKQTNGKSASDSSDFLETESMETGEIEQSESPQFERNVSPGEMEASGNWSYKETPLWNSNKSKKTFASRR